MPSGVNSSRPIEIRSYDPIDLPGRAKQSLKSLNEILAQTLRKLSPKCHTYYGVSGLHYNSPRFVRILRLFAAIP